MPRQTTLRQIIVISLVGYILVLILRYTEGILNSTLKILGMLLNLNPKIFEFLELAPELLIIGLWIILLFKLTEGFSWTDIIDLNIIRRFGRLIGILTIILFVVLNGLRFLEAHFWTKYFNYYIPDHELIKIKTMILQSLNLIEVIIVAIGFIKIFNKK